LADEKVAAVIEPSRDGKNGGGTGGTIFDDNGAASAALRTPRGQARQVPGRRAADRELRPRLPPAPGARSRRLKRNVETKFTGDHEHGFDTVAEIPGTDPKLKDQVVMVGGHLDSWIAGTGATDNGAGTIVAMEVMRILKALDVKPRRTIRIALWTGEEEGLFGSKGYVKSTSAPRRLHRPDQMQLPEFMRRAGGPLDLKPSRS
jgi:carboxypeptidase Q